MEGNYFDLISTKTFKMRKVVQKFQFRAQERPHKWVSKTSEGSAPVSGTVRALPPHLHPGTSHPCTLRSRLDQTREPYVIYTPDYFPKDVR